MTTRPTRPGLDPADQAEATRTADPAQARERFMAGLRRTETGAYSGQYTAINPRGAVGAYQMTSANFYRWSAEYGLSGADWRDPAVQDYVVRRTLDRYYSRYRDWELVAVAWFAGEPVADYARTRGGVASVGSITDSDGVALKDYATVVLRNMEAAPAHYGRGRIPSTTMPVAPATTTPSPQPYSPDAGLQQFIDQIKAGAPQKAPSPLRANLVRGLSTVSDMIASGRRSALPQATPTPDAQGVPELAPEPIPQVEVEETPDA